MMEPFTHEHIRKILQAGVKLGIEEQQMLDAHLSTCADCRAYDKLVSVLNRELPVVFSVRSFNRDEIRHKADKAQPVVVKNVRTGRVWRAARVGVGLLLLLALLFVTPRLLPQTASPSETTATPVLATPEVSNLAEEMTVIQPGGSPWTTYTPPQWNEALQQGREAPSISAILPASDNSVWFANMGGVASVGTGVYRYVKQSWVHLTTENGLPADEISDMVAGLDSTVWFSTLCCGVARFDGSAWTHYTTADGLASDDIRSMAVAPDGAIWFGTSDKGVSRYIDGTWQTLTTADGLNGNFVGNIFVLPDGSLLVSTSNGQQSRLNRFDGQAWSEYPTEWSDAGRYTQDVASAKNGDLWFATEFEGVYRLSAGAWTHYTTANGLASNATHAIAVATDGRVWVGTDAGVSRFDGTDWTTFTTKNGLAHNWVSALAPAANGSIWVGTQGGISNFDAQKDSALLAEGERLESPDGQYSAVFNPQNRSLEIKNAQGRNVQTYAGDISARGDWIYLGTWAPDSQHLTFWQGMFSGSLMADGYPLFIMDVQTGKVVELSKAAVINKSYQAWSRNGNLIAFSDGGGRSAQINKWLSIYSVESGQVKSIIPNKALVTGSLDWSPQGTFIAVAAVESNQTHSGYAGSMDWENPGIAARRIYVVNPVTGDYQPLDPQALSYQDAPRFSPDGSQLYFVQQDGNQARIMVLDINTTVLNEVEGCETSMPASAGYYGQVDWSELYADCFGN